MSELITFFRSLHPELTPHQIIVSEANATVLNAPCVTTIQPSAFKIHQFIAANLCVFNRLNTEEAQAVATGIECLRTIFKDDSIGAIALPLLNNSFLENKPQGCSTVICLNPIMPACVDADLSYQMSLLEDCICKDGVIQSYSFLSELLTESEQYPSRVCEALVRLFTYQPVEITFPEILELLHLLEDKEEFSAFKTIILECSKSLSESGAFFKCNVEHLKPFLNPPNHAARILLSWSLYNQLPIPSCYLENICLDLIDPELKNLLTFQYPFVNFAKGKIQYDNLKIFKKSLSKSQNIPFTKFFKEYPTRYSAQLNLPFLDCTIQHGSGKIRVGSLALFNLDYFRSIGQHLFKNNRPYTYNFENYSEKTVKALIKCMEYIHLSALDNVNLAELYTLADYLRYDQLRLYLKMKLLQWVTLQNLPVMLGLKPASFRHYCLAMARRNIDKIDLNALPEETFLDIVLHPRRTSSDTDTFRYIREWYTHHNRPFPIVYLLPKIGLGNSITQSITEDGRKIIHFQLAKSGASIKFRRDFNYKILDQTDDIGVYPEDIVVIRKVNLIKLPKFNVEMCMSFSIEVEDEMPKIEDISIVYQPDYHSGWGSAVLS